MGYGVLKSVVGEPFALQAFVYDILNKGCCLRPAIYVACAQQGGMFASGKEYVGIVVKRT
ncbi:MAG: hypothetical protein KY428_02200 [Bacteroidetes bacterium]|nr:hypothetical protein [Bacteroidota bacterium]